MGSDPYVRHMLQKKVEEVAEGAEKACSALEGEKQGLWTVQRSSLSQQLDYWLSLCYPSDIREAARHLDFVLWGVLQKATGLQIPRVDEGLGWECCPRVPVNGLEDSSYQEWLVRQPVKLQGLGLRSSVDTSPIAFIGALEMSVPSFVGEEGLCRQLEPMVGNEIAGAKRWQTLLQSGTRTGQELPGAGLGWPFVCGS